MPPAVQIIHETETPGGWEFLVQFTDESSAPTRLRLTMTWQEYDLYCPDGAVPPEAVARAVATVAREVWADELPPRLDAAALRRRDHGADERVIHHVDLSAM